MYFLYSLQHTALTYFGVPSFNECISSQSKTRLKLIKITDIFCFVHCFLYVQYYFTAMNYFCISDCLNYFTRFVVIKRNKICILTEPCNAHVTHLSELMIHISFLLKFFALLLINDFLSMRTYQITSSLNCEHTCVTKVRNSKTDIILMKNA